MEESVSSAHPLNLSEHVIGLEGAPLTPSGLTKSAENSDVSKRSYPMNSKMNSNGTSLVHATDTKRLKTDCTPTNLKQNHTSPDIRILGLPADENLRRACLLTCSVLESNLKFNGPTGVYKVHFAPLNLDIKIVRKDGKILVVPAVPPSTNPAQNQPKPLRSAIPSLNLPSSSADKINSVSPGHIKGDGGLALSKEGTLPSTSHTQSLSSGQLPFEPPICCISTCGRNKTSHPDIRIFSFPSGIKLRHAWKQACGIPDGLSRASGVCDAHFLPHETFDGNLPSRSIPTQNLPPNSKQSTLIWNEINENPIRCGEICFILTCGRGYRYTPNIRMFRFPLEENLRRAWIEACGIQESNLNICGSIRLCDEHFLPQDMEGKWLRRGAIPSQNLPPEGYLDELSSKSSKCDHRPDLESCNFCLHSEKRGDIFRARYKRLVRKLAILKKKFAEKKEKLKPLNFKLNPDLRRVEDRTRMKEVLQKAKLSNSAQAMFLMLMKPIQCWEDEEKELALSLYYKAPFDFYFMSEKLKLHLPSRSSMKRWVRLDQSASNPKNLEVKNVGAIQKTCNNGNGNIEENDGGIEDIDNIINEKVNGVDIVYEGAECDETVYEGIESGCIVNEGIECDDIDIKSEIIEIGDVGVYEEFANKCDTE